MDSSLDSTSVPALAAALIDSFGSFEAFQQLCGRGAGAALLLYNPQTKRLEVLALPYRQQMLPLGWVPRSGPSAENSAGHPSADQCRCPNCPAAWWQPLNWAGLGQRLAGARLGPA